MKPLFPIVVAINLVLAIHALPENIEDVKELSQSKVPILEAEESEPQARKERCTTCSGTLKLNVKSPKEVLASLTALPGAEVHTQQSFEGCSSDKGCAGIKVKDGQVLERFGNLDAFRAAAAQDTGNEFSFHPAGSLDNSVFEGGLPNGGPFWWMNQNSPFKNAGGASGSFEKFSKSSSSSFTSNGNSGAGFGAGGVDLSANPFLNGDFSKLASGFGASTGSGAAGSGINVQEANRPSTFQQSSFESSSFNTVNKGDIDLSKNPFLNGGLGNAGSFGFGAGNSAGSSQSGFSNVNKFASNGFSGSTPGPFTGSTAGSNVNLIQNTQKASEFDFDQQQQTQQNIDEAFQHTGNVHAHEHSGGDLQQTCAGQGYICVHKAQCNNGVVNSNGGNLLQARTQKQYCNVKTEICCRIELSGAGSQGSIGAGSATFSGSGQGNLFQGTGSSSGFGTGQSSSTFNSAESAFASSNNFNANRGVQNTATTGFGSNTGSGFSNSFGSNSASVNKGVSSSPGFGSTVAPSRFGSTGNFNNEVFKSTSQSNFIETDSFSAGSESAGVFRPGASGSGLKPGIPYLPPIDNTNSGSNIVPSTAFPTTFTTPRPFSTPRPFTTAKPTYLPPVTSTAAPGYLPPLGESSNDNPVYTNGGLILDETRPGTLRPPVTPGPSINDIPAGCAAALKCTPIEFCTAEGVISNTSVILTRDQEAYRVPLTDCKDIESGRVGKCCRDPFYTDPWPATQIGKWVPGVFGGNDGQYVPDSRGSPSTNVRPQVSARPDVGSVLLNNFRTEKPIGSTFGPNQITPGFPATTVSPGSFIQKGQFGQGQVGNYGQGQIGTAGQGQVGVVGIGQGSKGTQEQFAQGSQFSTSNSAFGQTGTRGQGQVVTQGQGQVVSQGQGFGVNRGQGFGVTQGQGVGVTQGQGFGVSQGQGIGVSQGQGVGISQGAGFGVTQGQGQAVSQGAGFGVTQGQGQAVSQGAGQSVSQGFGQSVSQGFGQGISQGVGQVVTQGQGSYAQGGRGQFGVGQVGISQQGQAVSQGQGVSASRGQGQGFGQGQGIGVITGQGASVSRGQGQVVTQGQGVAVSQGAGFGVSRGQGQSVSQGQGQVSGQGQGFGVSQGAGFGVSRGQGQSVSQGQGQVSSQGQGFGVSQGAGFGISRGQGSTVSQTVGQTVNQGQGFGVSQGAGFGVSRGQGQAVSQGQGFGVNQGQGFGVSRGQGQVVSQGQGFGVSQGQGQSVSQGQGFGVSQGGGFGVSRGQGQAVSQSVGQGVSQGQGFGISSGQGQAVTGGQGQFNSQGGFGIRGQGQAVSQGSSQSVSQGFGQSVSQGFGASRGQGQSVSSGQGGFGFGQGQGVIRGGGGGTLSFGLGQAITQGQGEALTQGQGQAVIQGGGQSVSQGVLTGVRRGQGYTVSQGAGFGVENEYSESVQRVFLKRYNGAGQCGVLNGQKPYGNRNDLEVDFAEISWQAMVLLQTNKSLLCGGVITRPDVVITSASCVDGLQAKNVLIKGGEWKLGIDDEPLPFQIVQVKTILRHPFYIRGSLKYDVAILVLSEDLRLAKNIYPICLPSASDTLDAYYNGAGECVVTGWGKQVLQVHLQGSIMHSLNVSLINPGECQTKLSQDYPHLLEQYDQDSCVCGQPTNPTNNICKVDIGSALACTTGDGHFTLRGVYSWDSGCQIGNQIAAFYRFDLEWYEWAIGLIESVRFTQYTKGTKITQNQYSGQINSQIKSSYTSGVKGSGAVKGSLSGVKGGQGTIGQFGTGLSGQFSQFGASSASKYQTSNEGSGSLILGTDINGPISNTYSATYSEIKGFQTEPKIVTYTTKPEIVTFTTKPEYFTYTTKPKLVTYTTKPQIITYTTKPEIISYTTKPEIVTYTTKPKIVTYTTKPQFITYETSGSGTNPQYVAPGVTFNPSFSDLTGKDHKHNGQCKCLEGK